LIRGSPDVADETHVTSWLYSPTVDLRGKVVLAFSADRCIGAGMIEIFREDLLAAGLGHGKHGFRFPIGTRNVMPGSVLVRLEGSDLSLLHGGSHVCARPAAGNGRETPASIHPRNKSAV